MAIKKETPRKPPLISGIICLLLWPILAIYAGPITHALLSSEDTLVGFTLMEWIVLLTLYLMPPVLGVLLILPAVLKKKS